MDRRDTVKNYEQILEGIIQGMSDGVIILGLDGKVQYTNPAAAALLDIDPEELNQHSMATAFYEYEENDRFNQTILNVLYDPDQRHYDLVPYYTGSEFRQLNVMTSILSVDGARSGIIMVISDITELASLRIRYTEQVTALLDSLVKSFSSAIDERSHYTANHTRNMVRIGTAFIDWLERSGENGAGLHFDEDRKKAFLMSVWLHDIGKLTIPLGVMDKATRLGNKLGVIEQRLDRIHLLDRVAMLDGSIDEETFREREAQREKILEDIRRINSDGFVGEDEMQSVHEMSELTYTEEDGSMRPVLTDEEISCLQIRKGTLTDEERSIMQSHADRTRRILENVEFPDAFADVPEWAARHHEMINGSGYPDHIRNGEIAPEVRLLTILDIFEALTAQDRPYKKPIPPERSLEILRSMADEGCIDKDILALFERSRAWEAQEAGD